MNDPKDLIVIIEDDLDDQDIMQVTIQDLCLDCEVVFFDNADHAFAYLSKPDIKPFMILSDINIPGINGLQLKEAIDAIPELKRKCQPYLFLTTSHKQDPDRDDIFIKPDSMKGWMNLFTSLIDYWKTTRKPDQ